ncbi:carboxylesterase [Coprinopsis marcescibilis]|uniref:Carboxylic ester hydrolase n=1 Tax=Coprinopsis marcescibilis TaxID=230819 RepID=A0A5C3L052_COPMA|nr:carboxylesterase [Coprinopsis marcescibilis]
MRFPALHALLGSLYVAAAFAQQGNGVGLLVNTQQGPVLGSRPVNTVRQWLGIPFATAGRWQPPVPPATHSSTFSATTYGNTCPQLVSPAIAKFLEIAHQDDPLVESEDCLTLNIWAPSKNRPQNTAVLIWIYGGGFQFGASALKVYNGRQLVQNHDDITIVSINYRLNIFGQPNAPQLVNPNDSQNFGLLDQRAAIQWVYDNIAAFGGDPNRISIFGQSAGGTSGAIYSLAYPADTIVKGIIEQSGGLYGLADLSSPTLDDATWHTVAEAVGCGNSPTSVQFTCMQGKPWQDLITAANNAGIIFFKLVTDERLIFSDYEARMGNGQFLRVPALVGNVAQEADALTVALNLVIRGNSPPFLTQVIADIGTQVGGNCPTVKSADQRFGNGVTLWRYRYQAIFPGISTRQDLRAFHGSEIPIVFGTYAEIHNNAPATEIALSQTLGNAWVAFARSPATGLTTLGWPTYNPTSDTLVQLGDRENLDGASFASPHLLDATCDSISTLLDLNMQFNALLAGV